MNSIHPSRRTVARSLAWSLPAVAVATAAPAFADSTTPGLPAVLPVLNRGIEHIRQLRLDVTNAASQAVTVEVEVPRVLPGGGTLRYVVTPSQTTWSARNVGTVTLLTATVPATSTSDGFQVVWDYAEDTTSDVVTLVLRVGGVAVQTHVLPMPFS